MRAHSAGSDYHNPLTHDRGQSSEDEEQNLIRGNGGELDERPRRLRREFPKAAHSSIRTLLLVIQTPVNDHKKMITESYVWMAIAEVTVTRARITPIAHLTDAATFPHLGPDMYRTEWDARIPNRMS